MDRLIANNTVNLAGADVAPGAGVPGYATDGNPDAGVPPTDWPAYAYNQLQEELLTFLTAAGIGPDRTSWTQVYKAVAALVQGGHWTAYADTGAANALVITPSPAIAAYAAKQAWLITPAHDVTGPATVAISGLATRAVVRNEDGGALKNSDWLTGVPGLVVDDGARLRLFNLPSLATRGWRNHVVLTASGSWVVPAGVTRAYVKVKGAGGGGGGSKTGSTSGAAGGGGEGGWDEGFVDLTPGATITTTIGVGGTAGLNTGANAAACTGGTGGTTSFGAAMSAVGGAGGAGSANSNGLGGVSGSGTGGDFSGIGQIGSPAYTPDAGGSGKGGDGGGAGGGMGGNGAAGTPQKAGSGGSGGSTTQAGAAGFRGEIEIFW